MPVEQTSATSPQEPRDILTSEVLLRKFFEMSPAGRRAASSLKKGVSVAVRFTDVPGDFRFYAQDGQPRFDAGKASDPDFELTIAPGAVRAITAKPEADIGELGITFFQHIVAKDPAEKIQVKLHAGLLKLTMHGWLGVLAAGGPKVMGWMAQKGLRGPSAVASALSRLRKG
ncbi:MAG: AAA family ATPase [Deltaproteobacteria bacterium]|nr:MAG: AAA family ATPase [Deltaproteobacteria bacterium]